jgi:hypothetical protein
MPQPHTQDNYSGQGIHRGEAKQATAYFVPLPLVKAAFTSCLLLLMVAAKST